MLERSCEINRLCQSSLIFFPALISGRLFDTGHLHVPLPISSVNLVLCTLLIAEFHEYWQFLLYQGLGVGVGARLLASDNCPLSSVIARRSHAVLYTGL
jgi:MCP family monocarboxylic acid transporter-like MFS transporter 10